MTKSHRYVKTKMDPLKQFSRCHSTPENLIGTPKPNPLGILEPPAVFLVSPTKQGIWYPHAKFPREFVISMQKFPSIQINHFCYGTLAYVRIRYNNHLKHLLQFHCSLSAENYSRPTNLRWYQYPHVSHSTISSYVSGI